MPNTPVRTRFAPSPTGYLHLGHVAHAIYVWGLAHALGGVVGLRLEDHDRLRSRPAFEGAILEDLDWLGFTADDGRTPVRRQSDDPAAYAVALKHLRAAGRVYACDCSRRRIGGHAYDGRCRDRGLPLTSGLGLRVRLDPGEETFDDGLLGPQRQTPTEQCGDLLVRDRNGNWTYQFSVTVDDVREPVTLVVRGADLLDSTGRQIQLARMLGRTQPPRFVHHPLLLRPSGEKLSKSTSDTGVGDLRRQGLAPAEIIGRAAVAVGILPTARPVEAREAKHLFSAAGGRLQTRLR
jgi:glutamyl-Q tRNA(Asp) synthetase